MKETEITVQVFDDFKTTIEKIKNAGFKLIEEYCLQDNYFTHISRGEIKNKTYKMILKNSFIIRTVTKPNISYSQLTYKDKEYNNLGEVVSEQKYVCKVENEKDAIKIFESSGLTNYLTVLQKLSIFKKDNTQFALQEVSNLGLFIEIEEQDYMKNLNNYDKISQLKNIAKSLELKLGNNFSCKKVEMLLKH